MIRIIIDWVGKKDFNNLIKYIESDRLYFEAQNLVNDLADKCVEDMQATITTSKKRPSLGSNLEDNITKEILNSTGGIEVGIGKISQLKTNAPYWEVLDQGGYVPYSTAKGAPLGSFYGEPPITGGSGANWERSGNKGFFMRPSKAIEGIDFIGKAIRNLDKELQSSIESLLKDYTDNISSR